MVIFHVAMFALFVNFLFKPTKLPKPEDLSPGTNNRQLSSQITQLPSTTQIMTHFSPRLRLLIKFHSIL